MYIDWDSLISHMANVVLLFIEMTDGIAGGVGGGGGSYLCGLFCLSKLIIVLLYILLGKTDGSRLDYCFG